MEHCSPSKHAISILYHCALMVMQFVIWNEAYNIITRERLAALC